MPTPGRDAYPISSHACGDFRLATGDVTYWPSPMTFVWPPAYTFAWPGTLLAIPVFLIVSPLLAFAVTIGLISWTVTYARTKTRRRAAELRATSGA
jgi:hypothetical protein